MSGDISRDTFRKEKHYESVRLQQGRVLLDADFNEQCEITSYRNEQESIDMVGSCGAPFHRSGFRIVKNKTDLTEKEKEKWKNGSLECTAPDFIITAGHYYVDGILCENDFNILYSGQPDLPKPQLVKKGLNLAYIDCWKRSITSVDDPSIREVALGGPDTATRFQTVWQVKTVPLPAGTKTDFVCLPDQWDLVKTKYLIPGSQGGLKAKVAEESPSTDACSDITLGGYTGPGNQLYRVQIHNPGKAGNGVTFTWSRENASITASCEVKSTTDKFVVLKNSSKDKIEKFSNGRYIEITDDSHELLGQPGHIVKIVRPPVGNDLAIEVSKTVDWLEFQDNPKVRLWDYNDTIYYHDKNGVKRTLSIEPSGNDISIIGDDRWYELEDGVLVCFEKDKEYHTGDYWMIPARSITRSIEWPVDENAAPELLRPHGPIHHYCPLAILDFDEESFTRTSDCRCVFLPLTELDHFFYVGGDGQEIIRDPHGKGKKEEFPQPLMVGVTNHHKPVEGVTIQFNVAEKGVAVFSNNRRKIQVKTGGDGIARCKLWVDAKIISMGSQRERDTIIVTAEIHDNNVSSIHTPIVFTATVHYVNASLVAYNAGNCPILSGVRTIQEAIDKLCSLWLEAHDDCTLKTVLQNGDVFIGEEGLDITAAMGNTSQLAWFAPGSNPANDPPNYIMNITAPRNFYVAPSSFVGRTGKWYRWKETNQGIAFKVVDPTIDIIVWDQNDGKDVTGKSVPSGHVLNFRVTTNIDTVTGRCGNKPVPGFLTIRVKTADGITLTALQMPDGTLKALTGLVADSDVWFWVAQGDTARGWATGALDANGTRVYKAGTYTVYAELNLNKMKDNYKAPDGSDYTGRTVTATSTVKIVKGTVTVVAAGDTFSLGQEINLSGSNSETDSVYLSIAGPNLPEPYVKLSDPTVKVDDNKPGTFSTVNVLHNKWMFKWQTANLKLDPGMYTIYALANPRKNIAHTVYGSVSIILNKPFSVPTVSRSVFRRGDTVRISGSADTPKVYLSISDANAPEKRSKLTALTVKTVDGNPATFTGVDVGGDLTWEYTWDTSKLKKMLEPGKYLIHVTTSPDVKDSVAKGEYGTVLVSLNR